MIGLLLRLACHLVCARGNSGRRAAESTDEPFLCDAPFRDLGALADQAPSVGPALAPRLPVAIVTTLTLAQRAIGTAMRQR